MIKKTGIVALLILITVMAVQAGTIYSKWPNAPQDPNFFLISVWLQRIDKIPKYKAIGINTYIAIDGKNDAKSWKALKNSGMYLAATVTSSLAWDHYDDKEFQKTLIAWLMPDEPDNCQHSNYVIKGKRFPSSGNFPNNCFIPPDQLTAMCEWVRKNDPTRPVYTNFGCGITDDDTPNRGGAWNNEKYPQMMKGPDIVGYDIYPVFTHARDMIWLQAQGLDRIKKWSDNKPMWNCFECTARGAPGIRVPSPNDLRSEIWISIIHGSMGLIYFCHEFNPECDWAFLNYPDMTDAAKKVNGLIKQLAPVLNSPNVMNEATVVSSNELVPIDIMLKEYDGKLYIFSAGVRSGKTKGTFTIPKLLGSSAYANVAGEARGINIENGSFTDNFNSWDAHIYSIPIKTAVK